MKRKDTEMKMKIIDNDKIDNIEEVLNQWEQEEQQDWEQKWEDDLKTLKELGF